MTEARGQVGKPALQWLGFCDGDFEEAAFAYLYDAAAGDFHDAAVYAFAVHLDGALSN